MDRKQQSLNAQETDTLVKAIKGLTQRNFRDWTGSGVMIRLTPITTGIELMDEFVINAEDLEEIKPLIIQSVIKSLAMRKILLEQELKNIKEILR